MKASSRNMIWPIYVDTEPTMAQQIGWNKRFGFNWGFIKGVTEQIRFIGPHLLCSSFLILSRQGVEKFCLFGMVIKTKFSAKRRSQKFDSFVCWQWKGVKFTTKLFFQFHDLIGESLILFACRLICSVLQESSKSSSKAVLFCGRLWTHLGQRNRKTL